MSSAASPAFHPAGSSFRISRIFDRSLAIYTRNFAIFTLVTLIASSPPLLLSFGLGGSGLLISPARTTIMLVVPLATVALMLLSQAILVHGAFQDLRSRPVKATASIKAGLRRFFPVLGIAVLGALMIVLCFAGMMMIIYYVTFSFIQIGGRAVGGILPALIALAGIVSLVVVGLALIVRFSLAVPVCVVEQSGPWRSLKRSAILIKGHRWRISGMVLLLVVVNFVAGKMITTIVGAAGGSMFALVGSLIWSAMWNAFFAILIVIT